MSILNRKFEKKGRKINLPKWWGWILAIDLGFITATTLISYLPSSVAGGFLHYFDLAFEMNVAAWWSGVSLFALALLAYQFASTWQDRARPAWILLSILLLLFSWDEIGSFHERAGGIQRLVPFMVLFALLVAIVLGWLFLFRQTRRACVLIALGFAAFGLGIFQEYLEQSLLMPDWTKGLRVGAEEGTELIGMFLILCGIVVEQNRRGWPEPASRIFPNPQSLKNLPILLFAGLVIHLMASVILGTMPNQDQRGNFAVWYPAAIFFLLACLFAWRQLSNRAAKWTGGWLLPAYFLLNSVAAIYLVVPRPQAQVLRFLGPFGNFYFFYAGQLIVLAIVWLYIYEMGSKKNLLVFGLLGLLLFLGCLTGELALQFAISGLYVYLLFNLFLQEQKAYERRFA